MNPPPPAISTTTVVERGIVTILSVLRTGTVIQVAVASWVLWQQGVFLIPIRLFGLVAILWSIAYFVLVIKKGSFTRLPIWFGVIDVVIAIATLIISALTLPSAWWIGTWLIWAPGYAASAAATIPGWLRSVPGTVAVALAISVTYVATALPGNTHQLLAIGNNAVSYIFFALAGIMFVSIASRLARIADEHQQRAAILSHELEIANYRFHVHNAIGLLNKFSRDDNPPELLTSLRKQADAEANRLRNEVLSSRNLKQFENNSLPARVSLNDAVAAAISTFSHLPLLLRTALGAGVMLPMLDAVVVETSLVALLYNAQFHAHATEIVIHTDQNQKFWEVSVADNGIGFDSANTKFGFGLGSQIPEACAERDISLDIQSAPGEGTIVTLTGQRR